MAHNSMRGHYLVIKRHPGLWDDLFMKNRRGQEGTAYVSISEQRNVLCTHPRHRGSFECSARVAALGTGVQDRQGQAEVAIVVCA
jgi:hypothetical protein